MFILGTSRASIVIDVSESDDDADRAIIDDTMIVNSIDRAIDDDTRAANSIVPVRAPAGMVDVPEMSIAVILKTLFEKYGIPNYVHKSVVAGKRITEGTLLEHLRNSSLKIRQTSRCTLAFPRL